MLGLYTTVLDALADVDLPVLSVFALGCVVGLATFSTLLNWALSRFHDAVLAVLIGLMIGSARVLWPWPADQGIGNPRVGPRRVARSTSHSPSGWLPLPWYGSSDSSAAAWNVGAITTPQTVRT